MKRPTRDYLRRAARARRKMAADQRTAFDLIVMEGATLPVAMERTGLSEAEFLKLWASAFRIHITEIEAKRPWWRWR